MSAVAAVEKKNTAVDVMQGDTASAFLKKLNNVMMNSAKLQFFGILLYKYTKRILTPKEYEQYSKLVGFNFLASCDFKEEIKLYPNSHTSVSDVVGSLVHELLHILGRHFERQGHRDPKLWNVVTDHCNNESIHKLNCEHCVLVEGRDILFKDIMNDHPFIKAEVLYDMFTKKTQSVSKDGMTLEQTTYTLEYKNDKAVVGSNATLTYNGQKYEIPMHMRPLTAEQKTDIMTSAAALWNSPASKESRGLMGEALQAHFDELFEVKLPWTELLENALKTELIQVEGRSWNRLNPLITVTNLPYNVSYSRELSTLLFVVDVSSSISREEIQKAISICVDAKRNAGIKALEVITHNTGVVERWEDLDDEQEVVRSLTSMKIGGGTSHTDVFQHIRDRTEAEIDYSIVVFMTDYYSDVEEVIQDYPEIHHLPFVWLLTSSLEPNLPMLDSKSIKV